MAGSDTLDEAPTRATPQPIIKSADMSEEMQKVAIQVATEAMAAENAEEKDVRVVQAAPASAGYEPLGIAAYIKKDFDKRYGPTWHAVVGKNYGSYCTHETGNFLYWYMGNIAILLFKAG